MAKFIHMSDVHLGGWKQQPMQDLNFKSFQKVMQACIDEKVDFVLIAGDLFDTAYPPIEILKETFAEFRKLKDAGIPCFLISGSHDYSVSGKTFLEVLEKSGFCKNVTDFEETENEIILNPTFHKEVVIYGFPGKKSSLDIKDLRKIKLREAKGYKILMLHTTIDKAVESLGNLPIEYIETDSLPETDYCALGHIHIRLKHKNFVYPGPVFPNNFAELEILKHGSFVIADTKSNSVKHVEIPIMEIESVVLVVKDGDLTEKIISELEKKNLKDKIVLLRLKGELQNSKTSDIKFSQIEDFVKRKGAYFLLKNTHDLKTREIEFKTEIETENIEEEIIKAYSGQNISGFNSVIPYLMNSLSIEKQEGETSESFSRRLLGESRKILNF